MYAVVRETQYREGISMIETESYQEFDAIHARQSGYRGTVVVDAGGGRVLTVTLWEDAGAMAAARAALEPVVARLLNGHMRAPALLIGTGPAIVNDLGSQSD